MTLFRKLKLVLYLILLLITLLVSVSTLVVPTPVVANRNSVAVKQFILSSWNQPARKPVLEEGTTITSTLYLPLVIANNQPPLPPIVPITTKVLTGTMAANLVAIAADASVLTFTQSLTQPLDLAPGEVLVSTPSNIVPNGLLRKVIAVTSVSGQDVVQTTAATLEEALQQGEVHISQALSPDNIQSVRYSEGVTPIRKSLAAQNDIFYLGIEDLVLYDEDGNQGTTTDQVLANGEIEVEPILNFDFKVENWQMKQLRFTQTTRQKVEIKVESKLMLAQLKREKELARYYLIPITVFVGTVPVVLAPIYTLVMGVDGDVHISVSIGVTQEATLTGGLQYSDGNWRPVSQYTNKFQFQPPTVSLGGDLKGYAGPRLQVLLYGVLGPQIKLNSYAKLEADTAEIPWWKLYGGLELSAEFRAEILGHELASYEIPSVIGVKLLLAQANSSTPIPTPTPTLVTPTPTPTKTPTPTIIPTPGGFVFCDNFSNPNSNWPTINTSTYTAGYQSGEYQINIFGNNVEAWETNPIVGNINYYVVADMRMYNGSPVRYGFTFDVLNGLNFYIFTVNPGSQHWSVQKIQNGTRTTLSEGTSSAINLNNATNRLQVTVNNNSITAYVNGISLTTVSGGAFSSSNLRVGLAAKAGTNNVTARFDDFCVQEQ